MMGLDIGSRRIGVAIGDELGILASPIGFVETGPQDRLAFAKIIQEHRITRLIVGIPRTMAGKEGPQSKIVRDYAKSLARDLEMPLTYWDERLTTVIAERSLISGGRSRRQRREEIDAAAAAVMLQGYLDHRAAIARTDSAILGEIGDPQDRGME